MSLDDMDPGTLRNQLKDLQDQVDTLRQAFVNFQALSEAAPELGDITTRIRDDNGNLRLVISPADLFDEFGIHSHLAGFSLTTKPQFWFSADDGAGVLAGGNTKIDYNGIRGNFNSPLIEAEGGNGAYYAYLGMLMKNAVDSAGGQHFYGFNSFSMNHVNLLANSDFETGTLASWVASLGSPTVVQDSPGDGQYCCQLHNGAAQDELSQTFNVTTGYYYLVRVFAKTPSINASKGNLNLITSSNGDAAGGMQVQLDNFDAWTKFCFLVKVNSGTTLTVAFRNSAGSSIDPTDTYIDNVRVDKIFTWGSYALDMGESNLHLMGDRSQGAGGHENVWHTPMGMVERASAPTYASGQLTGVDIFYPKSNHKLYKLVAGAESTVEHEGWMPYAYPIAADIAAAYTTAAALAANGGSIAIPYWLDGPMRLTCVTLRNVDATLVRTWGWDLYVQTGPEDTNITRVAQSGFDDSFTAAAASTRILSAASEVDLAPGLYWLVIQNRHATNTFGLGSTAASAAFAPTTARTKTTTNPNGATLDMDAPTWANATAMYAARLEGATFGEHLQAWDNASTATINGTGTATNSKSWSHHINDTAKTNGIVLRIGLRGVSAAPTAVSVTIDGVAATALVQPILGNNYAGIWYVERPAGGWSGSNITIAVAWTNNAVGYFRADGRKGMDFASGSPLTGASATGTSTAPSVNVAGAVLGIAVDVVVAAATLTVGAGQNQEQNQSAADGATSIQTGMSYETEGAAAGTHTMSWTAGASVQWCIATAEIKSGGWGA